MSCSSKAQRRRLDPVAPTTTSGPMNGMNGVQAMRAVRRWHRVESCYARSCQAICIKRTRTFIHGTSYLQPTRRVPSADTTTSLCRANHLVGATRLSLLNHWPQWLPLPTNFAPSLTPSPIDAHCPNCPAASFTHNPILRLPRLTPSASSTLAYLLDVLILRLCIRLAACSSLCTVIHPTLSYSSSLWRSRLVESWSLPTSPDSQLQRLPKIPGRAAAVFCCFMHPSAFVSGQSNRSWKAQ